MRLVAAACLCWLPASVCLAQLPSESQAARESEFDGLKLLGASDQDRRLSGLGTYFAYVSSDTRPSDGNYVCGGMSRDDVLSAAGTVAAALQSIPDSALARLRLRYIVLCSRATAGGQSIGGVPVAPLNLLMLDAAGAGAALQHRTLHELYHLIEYRFGSFSDPAWLGQFGSGYSNSYPGLLRTSPVGSGKPGFLNAYSETHPHEDRAELFAYLLLAPSEVAAQVRRDAVVRQKAEYVAEKCERLLGLPVPVPR